MAAKSIRKQVTCCAPVNIAVIKYCELHACSLVGGSTGYTRLHWSRIDIRYFAYKNTKVWPRETKAAVP